MSLKRIDVVGTVGSGGGSLGLPERGGMTRGLKRPRSYCLIAPEAGGLKSCFGQDRAPREVSSGDDPSLALPASGSPG